MQHDVDTVTKVRAIHILGINQAGQEQDNALMCQGRTLPWLQDTPSANVWGSWRVTWRDVVVLDADNKVIHVYNLTDNDLSDPNKYRELRGILVGAAR